jgi:hypothetical protein
MTTRELEEKLRLEVARWSAKGYAELLQLRYPIAYDSGSVPASPDFYETKVNVLEKTPDHVQVIVSVSDGEARPKHSLSDDFLAFASGRVES